MRRRPVFDAQRFMRVREAGEGSYSAVVTARDTRCHRRFCALKRSKFETNDGVNHDVVREIACLRALGGSPYVVDLYEVGFEGRTCVLVLKGMQRTLRDHYKTRRVGHAVIRSHFEQVVRGLVHLHARSWIHRDLKPTNLLVNDRENVCLADFGHAALVRPGFALTLETGTRLYRAPEVWSGQAYDERADVWSLGCTFLELCTGEYPMPLDAEHDLSDPRRARLVRDRAVAVVAIVPEIYDCLEPSMESRVYAQALIEAKRVRDRRRCAGACDRRVRPRPPLFARQADINAGMRDILLDWIFEVSAVFELPLPVRRRTVALVDAAICRIAITRTELQLVGMAAASLACKLESSDGVPEFRDWVYICDEAYTAEQLSEMETGLLVELSDELAEFQAIRPLARVAGAVYEAIAFLPKHDAIDAIEAIDAAERIASGAATFKADLERDLRAATCSLSARKLDRGLKKLWKDDWDRACLLICGGPPWPQPLLFSYGEREATTCRRVTPCVAWHLLVAKWRTFVASRSEGTTC